MEALLKKAIEAGFSYAVPLNVNTLEARQDVRDSCAEDKCRSYNKNWTCPPQCGTLEECAQRIRQYSQGILVQTVGELKGSFDWKGMMQLAAEHQKHFLVLAEIIREQYPNALCLGAGGCQVCKKCAFPEPCRFPEKACSSMEGYGLFVTDVCRKNDLPYYHGEGTLTYTGCFLIP